MSARLILAVPLACALGACAAVGEGMRFGMSQAADQVMSPVVVSQNREGVVFKVPRFEDWRGAAKESRAAADAHCASHGREAQLASLQETTLIEYLCI